MKKVIAIVGPTASGKTAAAVRLAKSIGGEVISCDSMQLYKKMDIGTAKPTEKEMEGIPHHLIGTVDPSTDYSCADYAVEAKKIAREIIGRGKMPIFCGGTGLYLDSALGMNSFSPDVPSDIRERLEKLPPDTLYEMLKKADPESAEAIHPNNVKRVIRALEITEGTGIRKSEWDRRSKETETEFDPIFVGLDFSERELLYERINKRVDLMLESGLLDEVRALDLDRNGNAAQAIGYKEIYSFIDGKLSYDEAVELLKKNTRNYAKRQLTWFRRENGIKWFFRDTEDGSDEKIYEYVSDKLK